MTLETPDAGRVSPDAFDEWDGTGLMAQSGTFLGAEGLNVAWCFDGFEPEAVVNMVNSCISTHTPLRIGGDNNNVLVNLGLYRRVFVLRAPSHAVDELLASVDKVYTVSDRPTAL